MSQTSYQAALPLGIHPVLQPWLYFTSSGLFCQEVFEFESERGVWGNDGAAKKVAFIIG